MNIRKHMEMLGLKVEDKVTGFKGVVTSVSFDLYGCVQTIVNPGVGEDKKPGESLWFDIGRLKVLEGELALRLLTEKNVGAGASLIHKTKPLFEVIGSSRGGTHWQRLCLVVNKEIAYHRVTATRNNHNHYDETVPMI